MIGNEHMEVFGSMFSRPVTVTFTRVSAQHTRAQIWAGQYPQKRLLPSMHPMAVIRAASNVAASISGAIIKS